MNFIIDNPIIDNPIDGPIRDRPTHGIISNEFTLNSCISLAANALNMNLIAEHIDSLNTLTPTELSTHDASELQILRDSSVAVVDEIAREYMPLQTTEVVNLNFGTPFDINAIGNARLNLSQLRRQALEILSVEHNGKPVRFTRFNDRIEFVNKPRNWIAVLTVTYVFAPRPQNFITTLEFSGTRISARLVSFGIAAEYCIRNGMTDEAILWDRRYKDALLAATRPKREVKIKPRRFK